MWTWKTTHVVRLVVVCDPVGGVDVHFDIAGPKHASDAQTGIQEVGSRVAVGFAWIIYDDRRPVAGAQVAEVEAMLPYVLEEDFLHLIIYNVWRRSSAGVVLSARLLLVEFVFHLVEECLLLF